MYIKTKNYDEDPRDDEDSREDSDSWVTLAELEASAPHIPHNVIINASKILESNTCM